MNITRVEAETITQCIEQINTYSNNRSGYLLTSDLGSKNGLKTRSYFFCLDRLWAWISGVEFDKNQVVGKVIKLFQNVKLEGDPSNPSVPFDKSDLFWFDTKKLKLFSKNIENISKKFCKKESKEGKALLDMATKIKAYVQNMEPDSRSIVI